jgi:hypothetical protein
MKRVALTPSLGAMTLAAAVVAVAIAVAPGWSGAVANAADQTPFEDTLSG